MIFKSYILEQDLKILDKYKLFLFYGENEGLKEEFKERLRLANKNLEILNLFQEEIIKNKNILINEIINKSLFEEKKLIFINQASDKIYNIIEDISENIDGEKIIIFADTLDKKSTIRTHFEKSKIYGIAPCYRDNEITTKKIILEKLKGYHGLSPQIINLIIESTGFDRNKINNEIQKIKSCFENKKIESNKLESLLNIRENEDFNELKDEALNGNKNKTNGLLADTVFDIDKNIFYLNSINQRIKRLNEIENLKQRGSNIESSVASLKPPVFWKDKPILIEQSKKWNKKKLQDALKKTYEIEIEIKSNASIKKDLLIKNLIIELCITANVS